MVKSLIGQGSRKPCLEGASPREQNRRAHIPQRMCNVTCTLEDLYPGKVKNENPAYKLERTDIKYHITIKCFGAVLPIYLWQPKYGISGRMLIIFLRTSSWLKNSRL